MKKPSYQGPGGECPLRDPIPFRIVNSGWFLGLWAAALCAAAGYYISFWNPATLLGPPLSPGHRGLATDCFHCHVPFLPVPDQSCGQPDCHAGLAANQTHNSMPCKSCHPMHTDGAFVPASLGDAECAQCHDRLASDPASKFNPGNRGSRLLSPVPAQIFPHGRHSGPGRTRDGKKKFACFQCHYLGPKTLNTPMQDLFTMDSCLSCKYHSEKKPGCIGCHNFNQHSWAFHLPQARTKKRDCVKQEELSDIRLHVMRENITPEHVPGSKDLRVCETGKPSYQGP